MQEHEHCCRHFNLKYCEVCKVVYCEDCKQEWKEKSSTIAYPQMGDGTTWIFPQYSITYHSHT